MSPRSTALGSATIGVLRPTRVARRVLITLTSIAVATTWTGTAVTTGLVSGPFQTNSASVSDLFDLFPHGISSHAGSSRSEPNFGLWLLMWIL